MLTRRFTRAFACGLVALGVLVVPVVAEELLGVLTKVDVEAKKITVVTKDDKEVLVTVTADTEYVTPKGSNKLDLEKVSKSLERIQEKGRKGLSVKVTHEDGVASKVESRFERKKGGRRPNE
jgi:CBS domain-containing protein